MKWSCWVWAARMEVFDLRKDSLFVKGTLQGEWHLNQAHEGPLGPTVGHYSPRGLGCVGGQWWAGQLEWGKVAEVARSNTPLPDKGG